MPKKAILVLAGLLLTAGAAAAVLYWLSPNPAFNPGIFDGARAFADLETQVSFGPRIPGSPGHAAFVSWAVARFDEAGWDVDLHETIYEGQAIRNIVARWPGSGPEGEWIILGAHYDTRPIADRDPDPANRLLPVPGANDGASGVAVLLELARVLPRETHPEVWIVLFDAEDGGGIDGSDWALGARAFVHELDSLAPGRTPDQVIVVDMIGDADLNIHLEGISDPAISAALWQTARGLGHGDSFIPLPKYSILDDHTPFLQAGIPAALIIDFDYPYWHTIADTPDKTSPESLRIVGETVLAYLSSP